MRDSGQQQPMLMKSMVDMLEYCTANSLKTQEIGDMGMGLVLFFFNNLTIGYLLFPQPQKI